MDVVIADDATKHSSGCCRNSAGLTVSTDSGGSDAPHNTSIHSPDDTDNGIGLSLSSVEKAKEGNSGVKIG